MCRQSRGKAQGAGLPGGAKDEVGGAPHSESLWDGRLAREKGWWVWGWTPARRMKQGAQDPAG